MLVDVITSATPHLFWITSRAAGIVALVLASLGVSLGLLMSTKLLRRRAPDLLAAHEVLSLSAIAAIAVHGVALIGDKYLHPSLADIAIPFVGSYKTFWTSTGIIAGWGMVLLGLSYYARRRIGAARWRKLHRFTALMWLAGLAHSLGEGTDAGQLWFLAMIAIVAIPAVMMLALRYLRPRPGSARAPRAVPGAAARSTGAARPAAAGQIAAARPAGATRPAGSPNASAPRPRPRRPISAAAPLTAQAGGGRRSR